MSSVSSASSSNVAYYASQRNSLFNKLDSNQDGTLSEDEFASARPANVSESQAAKYYSRLGTSGTGDESDDSTDQSNPGLGGIQSLLTGNAMAVLVLMSPQGGMPFGGDMGGGADYGRPTAADMYSAMDADGDGSVSKDEFLAARPDNMSEDAATKVYDSIDTTGTGSITEDQFSDALKSLGGHHHGGMAPAAASQDSSSDSSTDSSDSADGTFDALDTNKDGIVSEDEFLAGHPEDVTDEQATDLFDSIDTQGTGSITKDQFEKYVSDALGTGQTDTAATDTTGLPDVTPDFSFDPSKGVNDLLTMLGPQSSDGAAATEAA